MNFREDLAAAVVAGTKTTTRRLVSENPRSPWWREKCGYRVGQEVAVCPGRGKHQIGKAVVISVSKERLGRLTYGEAIAEGFTGREDFRAAWVAINGGWDPWALVWRIGLEAVAT